MTNAFFVGRVWEALITFRLDQREYASSFRTGTAVQVGLEDSVIQALRR